MLESVKVVTLNSCLVELPCLEMPLGVSWLNERDQEFFVAPRYSYYLILQRELVPEGIFVILVLVASPCKSLRACLH